MLSVSLQKKQKSGTTVWKRNYYTQNELTETIVKYDKQSKVVNQWNNKYFHWISPDFIPSVKRDYIRLGWSILQR